VGAAYTLEVFLSSKIPNLDCMFPNTKPYLVGKINDNYGGTEAPNWPKKKKNEKLCKKIKKLVFF